MKLNANVNVKNELEKKIVHRSKMKDATWITISLQVELDRRAGKFEHTKGGLSQMDQFD